MNENETRTTKDNDEPREETTEPRVAVSYTAMADKSPKKSRIGAYTIALVVVVVIILGALYSMEKEGRSSTRIFSSIIEKQEANRVVATVNGEEIINSELNTSIQQFTQAATAQGVDTNTPDVQTEIRTQALDVLINTELLRQDAVKRGFSVSEEEANTRLESIKTDIGGADILAERMTALGITEAQLAKDVRNELLIKQLLDTIFAEAEISVTEEEITDVYQNAGGTEAGLPALEEVKDQVESEVRASKEQAAIDAYLTTLKADAEVETM